MENWNYVEFVLIDKVEDEKCINMDIGRNKFLELLSHISNKYVPFSRNMVRYSYDNLIYERIEKNQKNCEIKTYEKTPVNVVIADKTLKMYSMKSKVPHHLFPSTNKLQDIQFISSMVFRFHNNIYLNFDIIKYPNSSTQTHKVYINYNCDMAIDIEKVNSILKDTENQINSSGVHLSNFEL